MQIMNSVEKNWTLEKEGGGGDGKIDSDNSIDNSLMRRAKSSA